jgi:hypothetical protein
MRLKKAATEEWRKFRRMRGSENKTKKQRKCTNTSETGKSSARRVAN